MSLARVASATLVVGLFALRSAVAAPSMEVYVVDPPVTNQFVFAGEPLPKVCKQATTIQVAACRGEYEPASFVVKSESRLADVRVEVGRLSGKAGTLPKGTVDVRAVAPFFRRITDYPGLVPWVLVHDPGLISVDDQPQPQALKLDAKAVEKAYSKTSRFTREPVDTDTLQPADIDGPRQFWITVHVTSNAKARVYAAPISIIPANAPASKLKLVVKVYPFDLKPPNFTYSVYYPAWIEGGALAKGNTQNYVVVSDQQYLAEMKNMVAHGCTNPTVYDGPSLAKDGTLDFTVLARVLSIREKAGMSGGPPFLLGTGPVIVGQQITPEEGAKNAGWVREIVKWAKQRGYSDVYFYATDEAMGEKVKAQRDAFKSIHEGGGQVFVANYGDFYELVGDLLDLPILLHPCHLQLDKLSLMPAKEFLSDSPKVRAAADPDVLLQDRYQEIIRGVHRNGFKIFTYMDPLSGYTLPFQHRLFRGFGLWKTGIDGTMTWAYAHITEPDHSAPGPIEGSPIFNFVLRGKNAPLDTLAWEAYREGYDDARYLATLEAAMDAARRSPSKRALIRQTEEWLKSLSLTNLDPDSTRREIARRIERLRG